MLSDEQRKDTNGKADTKDTPHASIHENLTNVSFGILVRSVPKNPIFLRKHMCIVLGTGSRECMVELEQKRRSKTNNRG